jgi:hypothetical protein
MNSEGWPDESMGAGGSSGSPASRRGSIWSEVSAMSMAPGGCADLMRSYCRDESGMDCYQWRQIACFGRARVFVWYLAEYCRHRGGVCLLHHRRWRWTDKMRSQTRIRWVKAVEVSAHIPKILFSPVSCNFKSGYGPEDQMHASNCRHDYPARICPSIRYETSAVLQKIDQICCV